MTGRLPMNWLSGKKIYKLHDRMTNDQTLKRIAIFGSTGSIGTQALEVIAANQDKFSVEVLTAHNNDELLVQQALKFSPNVVLRPVYEEVILPNLAYIGGPSEVPYWLQLKPIFDFHQIEFPILMPRNFGMFINNLSAQRIQKLGLSASDLFLEEVTLKKRFVERNTNNILSLLTENEEFKIQFENILTKAIKVDKTLEGAVQAEQKRFMNGSEKLEKRIRKAEERKMTTEISQLAVLKEKLFPNGIPQERIENFLNFSFENPKFLTQVSEVFDPLDFSFYLMVED